MPAAPQRARARLVLGGLLALAAALRVAAAARRSLWLDEFHTLHHLAADGPAALLASLRADNHPPLAFLLLDPWVALVGEDALLLRLPNVALGLAACALAWTLVRRLGGPRAAAAATAVLAASSLHVVVSAEARMYALLALAVAGLVERLDAWWRERRVPWRLALWVAVGLHAHYWFAHHLALAGAAVLAGAALWPAVRERLRASLGPRGLAALALGPLLAVPWYATGFREQLLGHDLWPGGSGAGLARLAQSYVHLLFHNASLAGDAGRLACVAAAALALALSAHGALRLVRDRDCAPGRATGLALALQALALPVVGFAASQAFPRAGFNWTYLAGAAPPFAALVGVGWSHLGSRARAVSGLALGVPLLALAALNAAGPGTEDLRGAVGIAVRQLEPGDAVLPVEWQPAQFPHGQAWEHYFPRLRADDTPEPVRLDHGEHYQLREPSPGDVGPERYPRVLVVVRGLPDDAPLLEQLRERYPRCTEIRLQWGVRVLRFDGGAGATTHGGDGAARDATDR